MYGNEKMLLAFIVSLLVVVVTTDRVIDFSRKHGIVDNPDEKRKLHKETTPNMGGVCVFIATMFAYFTFSDYQGLLRPDKLFSITILLFFVGLKDDIEPVKPFRRLAYEFLCAFFIIYITDLRIPRLFGVLYVDYLPYWSSFILTSVFIVACINAYNMIDGIDGLLGTLGLIGSLVFGLLFYEAGEWLWALLCVSLSAALLGFLIYNWQAARIFMGNGGSMFIGTVFACFSLRIMQLNQVPGSFFSITMPQTMVLGIIAIPLIDMLVVFMIRLLKHKSPFKADCRHVHHRLIQLGMQHYQTVILLGLVNIIIILFAYAVQNTGALKSILYTLGLCFVLELILIFIHHKKGLDN